MPLSGTLSTDLKHGEHDFIDDYLWIIDNLRYIEKKLQETWGKVCVKPFRSINSFIGTLSWDFPPFFIKISTWAGPHMNKLKRFNEICWFRKDIRERTCVSVFDDYADAIFTIANWGLPKAKIAFPRTTTADTNNFAKTKYFS